jgi:hypothetical protein
MQYRVKEEIRMGKHYFYPQYKKFFFWRNMAGYRGTTDVKDKVVYPHLKGARDHIEIFKDALNKKKLDSSKQVLYHSHIP